MCVKCVCASDRHGRKGLGLEAVVGPRSGGLVVWWSGEPGRVFWSSGNLRSRLEEPPVGREGETALEPSGRWEREPTLYLPSARAHYVP